MKIYLQAWLFFAASLRAVSVYFGFFDVAIFQKKLFDLQPDKVNDLYGRTFGIWTLVTCIVTSSCAYDLHNATLFGVTWLSFLCAFGHFTSELAVFKTLSIKGFLSPAVVSGVSLVWMGVYYLLYRDQFHSPPPPEDTSLRKTQ
ncbi:unnamed protein product [Vitrella brassicaformis CCMP3155]|uniref:Ergosterol biosynthetic protein 28 n=2 Tax=Vitrella brassicaformis TaxID=1169539 RepID=A0A0G4EHS7_VITBC|nr:unnamed protein product [Vitrella brassicaformis CCMP3155]|mmetsp:Transcript_48047/g.120303  ORF Transcript_48047/g.120303 Transcript_48047/m.120303 type:complete len:144 (+) Transcript_48047:117-548(+)|eukprot:CEL95538.1 unnamed protein product [Vitrella brassicaformis CCMP3155]